MIALLVASVLSMTGLEAIMNAPRDAFKACLKEATVKASTDKVGPDAYEAYVRNACGAELGAFKGAVVKFDMGNKMSRKASDEDADQMISDFVDSSLDHYKYITGANSAAKQQANAPAPAAKPTPPPPTPAAAGQPPK